MEMAKVVWCFFGSFFFPGLAKEGGKSKRKRGQDWLISSPFGPRLERTRKERSGWVGALGFFSLHDDSPFSYLFGRPLFPIFFSCASCWVWVVTASSCLGCRRGRK